MLCILQASIAALALVPAVSAHTWIEQLRNVNDKGQYVGEYGYPRGMYSKTDPGYNGFSMNFEIPAYQQKTFIEEDTLLCHKDQRQQKQSKDAYPRLQAVPGGFIAMRYMENGHITKPENQKGKPEKAGTVFVYGTTQPKEDEKLANVLRWTTDGKGGDARGVLLTMNDFDDGRCYETNDSPTFKERTQATPNYALGQADSGPGNMPLFCETNVQLPETAAKGEVYTFYWVWQWNTAPGEDPGLPKGKDEYYSTCIDVDVTSSDTAFAAEAESKFALGQQDNMSVAVDGFASRTAIMTDALKGEVGPIFSGKQTPTPSAPGGAPSENPSVSAPAQAPVPSSKAPGASGKPVIPTLTQRPGAAPSSTPDSSNPGDGSVVTVTDTVMITVTASPASQKPSTLVTSKRVASSVISQNPIADVTPPASRAPPGVAAPSAGIQSPPSAAQSKLPGFDMGNPNGAKFRGMFT
ncbi:hypothetical protein BDU57DRAFT_538804 [Ampelomyces quisqualis]|uniref:DUF7492 domain-containing protein n=1 Tax=Ampelomyces quisqualis TaxID=50730 RepID=A0A6A5QLN4_AMPQU|nr:hypothetical protein BDU57DRAFT_538804 [Ampelomyces quisqualis]